MKMNFLNCLKELPEQRYRMLPYTSFFQVPYLQPASKLGFEHALQTDCAMRVCSRESGKSYSRITCPKHGELFEHLPYSYSHRAGCPLHLILPFLLFHGTRYALWVLLVSALLLNARQYFLLPYRYLLQAPDIQSY